MDTKTYKLNHTDLSFQIYPKTHCDASYIDPLQEVLRNTSRKKLFLIQGY